MLDDTLKLAEYHSGFLITVVLFIMVFSGFIWILTG